MDFIRKDDCATVFVDGSADKYNVYWTIIKIKAPSTSIRGEETVKRVNIVLPIEFKY